MQNKHIKELSIQVNLSGLSFCIFNRSENLVEYLNSIEFEQRLTPFKLLEELEKYLDGNSIFQFDFSEVTVIHQNELATFVPEAFYNEELKADYLKYNSKILQTDLIATDKIHSNKSINVFVPYVNINNYIYERFGEFNFTHASKVLVDASLQQQNNEETTIYINVNTASFELVAIGNSELLIYNTFTYTTPEDFVYFIVFAMEQLELDRDAVKVVLSGKIDSGDDLYSALYNYVRHVEFRENNTNFKFDDATKPSEDYKHYLILNSF